MCLGFEGKTNKTNAIDSLNRIVDALSLGTSTHDLSGGQMAAQVPGIEDNIDLGSCLAPDMSAQLLPRRPVGGESSGPLWCKLGSQVINVFMGCIKGYFKLLLMLSPPVNGMISSASTLGLA